MPIGRQLYDFAYIHNFDTRLQELADIAEDENWNYAHTTSIHPNPVLYYYFHHTFERVQEQNKIICTEDGSFCCFNTGLVTIHQEAIFALFTKNTREESEPWRFAKFCRKGEHELTRFPKLPNITTYFDDPSCLVFDARFEIRVNLEHIINENKERFPEPFKTMDDYALQVIVKGAIDNAKERSRRNYKVAVPQFYQGQVQLLLPLCLSNPNIADLALLISKHEGHYRAATCLKLDMAYNNARQLAKPDREWLVP